MKKVLFALVMIVALGLGATAQNNIGVRLGAGSGKNAEISWQHNLGGANRLEVDFGWAGHEHWAYYNLSGVYQWCGTITGPLGWYAGLGANLGMYSWNNGHNSDFGVALGGQLGIELNISNFPLQFTLDARPMWNFLGDNAGFGWGAALGIRFKL